MAGRLCRGGRDLAGRASAGGRRVDGRQPAPELAGQGALRPSFRAVESCLAAAHLGNEDDVATSAIDELRTDRRPIVLSLATASPVKGCCEHSAAASALLTAFAVAGRLPYAMLADELIQFSRRSWWNERLGGLDGNARPSSAQNAEPSTQNAERFVANCEMARVLCRYGPASCRQQLSRHCRARTARRLRRRRPAHARAPRAVRAIRLSTARYMRLPSTNTSK